MHRPSGSARLVLLRTCSECREVPWRAIEWLACAKAPLRRRGSWLGGVAGLAWHASIGFATVRGGCSASLVAVRQLPKRARDALHCVTRCRCARRQRSCERRIANSASSCSALKRQPSVSVAARTV